ncbi:MAG: hypothetical protein PVH29_13435 [Candidatus Zixiibacteriota bacterium]
MPKKLLRIAAVVYFVLTAYWLLMGLVQVSSSLMLIKEEDTLFTFILGLWNMCIAHAYVAIGVGLVYETPRAKDWGLWSAVLSAPVVLIMSGLSILGIFEGLLFLIVGGLLLAERLITRDRGGEGDEEGNDVLPNGEQ